MSELIQFKPARAKKKLNVSEVHTHVQPLDWEQKIDGERYILHAGQGCTSRRESVVTGRFVEKSTRVPHLVSVPLPHGTLTDCEFVSSGDIVQLDLPGKFWDKMEPGRHASFIKSLGYLPVYPHVGNTVSIMGSNAELAILKQKERGLIWAYAFDIITYEGKSLTHNKQAARRRFLHGLSEGIDPTLGWVLMPQWNNLTSYEVEELFYLVTDIKGEGLVGKDPTQKYNAASAWYKLKIDYPCSVVLTGNYAMGKEGVTGKMVGLVGTLEIGVFHNNELLPIGWISAIMDGESNLQELTRQAYNGELRGTILECRHNGLQSKKGSCLGYSLRHPRFRRYRVDKNPEDCTWEMLQRDCK